MDFKANHCENGQNPSSNPVSPFPSVSEPEHIGLIPDLDRIEPDSRPQIWKCTSVTIYGEPCGQLRQWGFGPNTSDPKAILFCHTCRKPTRHTYDNWVPACSEETRKKRFPNIDFGSEE